MARSRRRSLEIFSLSFLDCICCGFGALVLLLALSRIARPVTDLETGREDLVASLQAELRDVRGDAEWLDLELSSARKLATETQSALEALRLERGRLRVSPSEAPAAGLDEGELRAALQRLTEEMQRLRPDYRRSPGEAVAGIPADSEYVIFVIDTSGSMRAKWELVMRKLDEVLDVYPKVKGLQIMNDNGRFMFQRYGATWLPDTPQMRQEIRNVMPSWGAFSDSDPSDGVAYAIETFWSADRKIGIYVFGDEFDGGSIAAVLRDIDEINVEDENGERRVRIHAIGFPYSFDGSSIPVSSQRFAALMRALCHRNGGTFVAVTESPRR